MQINIKRVDETLPLPEYHTPGSVAFDLYARVAAAIAPRAQSKIPTNLVIATPPGWALIISARSSLAHKKGLLLPNGIGVIDNDYCGPADEIQLSVYNFTDTVTTVERGERLAQGMFIKIDRADWNEKADLKNTSRGGFGSTGIST